MTRTTCTAVVEVQLQLSIPRHLSMSFPGRLAQAPNPRSRHPSILQEVTLTKSNFSRLLKVIIALGDVGTNQEAGIAYDLYHSGKLALLQAT